MEISIKGNPKEIADLVVAIQGQRNMQSINNAILSPVQVAKAIRDTSLNRE